MAEKRKRGRPRKKTDREIVEELKQKKKSKRKILPGKWSNIEPSFQVTAKLKKIDFFVPGWPAYLGKYLTHDDGYDKDGFRALIKISVKDLDGLISKHGIDHVLAACERSLNSYKFKNKKVLGDLVIMELREDEKSKRENYLPCLIKTNRKHIPKFLGMKNGELQVL